MKNKELETLGFNIKIERLRKHLSQEKLAEMADIQMQHLSKIENGMSDLRFTTLVAILKALNLKFDDVYNIRD